MGTRPRPPARTKKKRKAVRAKNRRPDFCVSCSDELESFCFTPKAADISAVHARALRCKITGRAKGKKCALVFIAQGDRVPTAMMLPPSRASKKTIAAIRKNLRERIRREPAG